jgi:hypothetical protein
MNAPLASERRVDSFREIHFAERTFKILAPCVRPYDLVEVLPTDQGVALYCKAAHVTLPYVQITPSNIGRQDQVLTPAGIIFVEKRAMIGVRTSTVKPHHFLKWGV